MPVRLHISRGAKCSEEARPARSSLPPRASGPFAATGHDLAPASFQHRDERQTVRIAIIGTGKMGRGFAQAIAPTHEVVVGSRDPDRAAAAAAKTGATGGATYADAAATADVVILTVPWNAMEDTLGQLGQLRGTVVIDVSYPYTKREREALTGTSTAELVQKRLPRARVLKGWNHVHAKHLTDPQVHGIASSVLITGDDPNAKDIAFEIARDMGFHPVDAGPLKATRDLEKLVGVMLFLRLGPIRVLSPP
jgi:8-hydroxy-5-deazaflavin:NADPH oxidoreductase